ncbi:hypothetical protein L6164_022064 [Bauhinia variegata]|uniref:Uncharacterized protein n=1 Tax=Bauhinia variegata TaxID=167791 RepID=A0ACB9MFE5_BAUVA|nr:hypothetical protein L6164_022064 [Bauhinia variegata]
MEPPVIRSRGRPRKRRKEDESGTDDPRSGPEMKKQVVETRPIALVGRYVLKEFNRTGIFLGKVVYYDCGLYRVHYEDGDYEDLDSSEIRGILLNDHYFDDDLTQRRRKLDELVLKNGLNIKKEQKSSVDPNNGVSSELHGGLSTENVVQVEGDADSSSDSSVCSKERDSGSDAETSPPPPLQLPPSSGTIGAPEQYVSHLFSVYGFLRSFSIRLFISPFSLDDFVGSLNCRVSNTLFDAIHVSLMRALRRHLEMLSSEGSERASKCLRCNDWSLLDTLTWPVFVIQYLAVHGYTKGPEWKGFYEEIFNGEYYLLPVSRKLIILQILCDDVLESEELEAEMNMREESEVGVDYDTEDMIPVENLARRVHPRYAKTSACKDNTFITESNPVKLPGNSVLVSRDSERNEAADVDRNCDECRLCGMDGTLLCCDGCPSAYHSRCIGVMKTFIPEGPWYCPECKISMTGSTITKGTSLRGAEIFGIDLYGQVFMGTCEHLLVSNINGEFCLRYYNQNDIPNVLQVLCASLEHRPLYYGICKAVLQYWNLPESALPLTVTNLNSVNTEEYAKFSSLVLPSLGGEECKDGNLVKAEYTVSTVSEIHGNNMVPSHDASFPMTERKTPVPISLSDTKIQEFPMMNTKHPEETMMESVIPAGSVIHQGELSGMNYQSSLDRSSAADPAMCTLLNGRFSYCRYANDMRFPMNLSSQIKEGNRTGSGKSEHNLTSDFVYMGSSYKPQTYINYYVHGDFAASAAAKLAVLSSEDSRAEGHVSENLKKPTSGNTYLQAKAFSLTASRFFWPSSEKKLVEVPRERCGWCLSCKAPVSSKRGCMLNHAAISATKSATKILAGLCPVRSGEGILPSIATYIIYMEESLRGLVVGPFESASYRKQWRQQVEQATTFRAIKPLLIELEENIRTITFTGDWVKLMDDWLVESSMFQSLARAVGPTQKRLPGRRNKKQLAIDEVTADGCNENNFAWWHGGKFTKFIFQKAVLPKSMIRKAARQGGWTKIFEVFYADGSEIPKRSRQLVWRAAVQMSRNASQLALQVRYLDVHLRWNDLIRPEQNLQDGKGQETEASAFRNANICDKKVLEGKILYGIAFGSQRHLSSRVMKNIIEIEQGPEGREKYWFSEARIPLYLVKEYEEGIDKVPFEKGQLNLASQLNQKRLKAPCKDIFFYLICKRDKLDMSSCSVCQLGVLIGNALKCGACQGYCHESCSVSSTISTNQEVKFLSTCKQCYNAKLLTQKVTSNESPTSPLLLQRREHGSITVLKGPRPKCYDQTLTSTRTKDTRPDMKLGASDSVVATKPQRRNCSWGIIWKRKNNDNTGIEFRLKNILLKGGRSVPHPEPVCHLCRKPYRPDLMYICCETCKNWYHAEAVELEESKISDVLGFKCCKCRRIKSPVCPYSDSKNKMKEGKKTQSKSLKNEHSGADSDSGILSELKECEPATPVFPVEDASRPDNDPLLFSLSRVELITEHNAKADVELNAASVLGPRKLPVRRHVKREGDGDGSYGSKFTGAEFSTHYETSNLSEQAEKASSPFAEFDSNVHLDSSDLLNDCETVNYECMEFEPHTYFSLKELLPQDDSNQFEGADASGDLSEYWGDSCTQAGFPEESGTFSLIDNFEPTTSLQDNAYTCWQCSQVEPAPDLSCEICGLRIHSQCSPWVESPSRIGSWKCGNCREWR